VKKFADAYEESTNALYPLKKDSSIFSLRDYDPDLVNPDDFVYR